MVIMREKCDNINISKGTVLHQLFDDELNKVGLLYHNISKYI